VKGWNKGNFSIDARLLLVRHVLSAMHIYQLLVIDPPVWLMKAIDKLRRGFLWDNDELAAGGKCLVKWANVCKPLDYGGLGITDLKRTSMALQVRWLWQSWTEPDKAWLGLPINVGDSVLQLFNRSVIFNLGDGQRISFWKDPWLGEQAIQTIAPDLFKQCTKRNLTVAQALLDGRWRRHFRRGLTTVALEQFLLVHDRLESVQLQPGVHDTVTWRWTADGQYSASSAYEAQFEGHPTSRFRKLIWKSEAPLKCRIFAWLAILGKCNTADTLAKKNWPHNAACVLCLGEPETAIHLLATCPVAIRIWRKILTSARLPLRLASGPGTVNLQDWLHLTRRSQDRAIKKNWISLVHLAWWTI
jgi:hypothetical protein